MRDTLQKQLLKMINSKKDFSSLISNQITYSQIASYLVNFEKEGLIHANENGYFLTSLGKEKMQEKASFQKIEPLDEFRIEKINIDQIYIPDYIEGVIKELKN